MRPKDSSARDVTVLLQDHTYYINLPCPYTTECLKQIDDGLKIILKSLCFVETVLSEHNFYAVANIPVPESEFKCYSALSQ